MRHLRQIFENTNYLSEGRKYNKSKILPKKDKVVVDTHEEKNKWWKKNSKGLISLAPKFTYDDLMIIFNNNHRLVNAISKTTPRRIALSIFHTLSIEDLEDIVNDNFIT